MQKNRDILRETELFDFFVHGHNQAVCKQTGGSIECPLNQWLACEICQQLVFPKASALTGRHENTACVSVGLIQIENEDILMCKQTVQERKLLLADDHQEMLARHQLREGVLIFGTGAFEISDFINGDPVRRNVGTSVKKRNTGLGKCV